jgi:hypothetical protein
VHGASRTLWLADKSTRTPPCEYRTIWDRARMAGRSTRNY